MTRKAVPAGFCAECRWARELPEKLKMGPFVLDCQAQPWQWAPQQLPQSALAGISGPGETRITMLYVPRPHQASDFCAWFEQRPAESDALPEGGLGIGIPADGTTAVPRETKG